MDDHTTAAAEPGPRLLIFWHHRIRSGGFFGLGGLPEVDEAVGLGGASGAQVAGLVLAGRLG